MQTYKFDGYTMTLHDTGETGEYGKTRVAYTFAKPDDTLLFYGRDLFTSPMHTPEGLDNAKALLSFLTCQPGDVDDDYFKAYTDEQMEWANSFECEQLQIYSMDEE